jgi:hypothetical protein
MVGLFQGSNQLGTCSQSVERIDLPLLKEEGKVQRPRGSNNKPRLVRLFLIFLFREERRRNNQIQFKQQK